MVWNIIVLALDQFLSQSNNTSYKIEDKKLSFKILKIRLKVNKKYANIKPYIICRCMVYKILKSKQLRKDKNKSKKIPQIS